MDMSILADVATDRIRREKAAEMGYGPGARIGWEPPTVIHDDIRRMDASVDALDRDITTNVSDAVFLASWRDWRVRWKEFVKHRMEMLTRLGTILYPDALRRDVDRWSAELMQWRDGYTHQKLPNGSPVPPPSAPASQPSAAPTPWTPPKIPGITDIIPWWGWVIGGVIGVGVVTYLGYSFYKTFIKVKKDAEQGEALLRGVGHRMLSAELGVPLQQLPAHRDMPTVIVNTGAPPSMP